MFRVRLFIIKIYKIISLIEFSVKLFIELISNVAWLQLIVGGESEVRGGFGNLMRFNPIFMFNRAAGKQFSCGCSSSALPTELQ